MPLKIQVKAITVKKYDYPGDPEGEPTTHLMSHFLIPVDIQRKKKRKKQALVQTRILIQIFTQHEKERKKKPSANLPSFPAFHRNNASAQSALNIIPLCIESLKCKGRLDYKSFIKIHIFKFIQNDFSFIPIWCLQTTLMRFIKSHTGSKQSDKNHMNIKSYLLSSQL